MRLVATILVSAASYRGTEIYSQAMAIPQIKTKLLPTAYNKLPRKPTQEASKFVGIPQICRKPNSRGN